MRFLPKGLEPGQRINLFFQRTKVGRENIKIVLIELLIKRLTENDVVNDISQQRLTVN